MRKTARFITAAVIAAALLQTALVQAQVDVRNTPHDLSAGGPGSVRAATDQRVCVFCHAPHHTTGAAPLWNRSDSTASYVIYSSSTLDSNPGQPVGVSKYCLSCHDGTIALGAVSSEPVPITMTGSQTLSGRGNLGTDLSDDHPISLDYTSSLAAIDHQLVDPSALPASIRLDTNGQIQCTTCHDAHNNALGNFLVVSDQNGALCRSCHQMTGWSNSPHNTSPASVTGSGNLPYPTVQQNSCRSCHVSHTAGQHERLLIHAQEEQNCLNCHDGQTTTYNIQAELGKTTSHDPRLHQGRHDPVEAYYGASPHVECEDCHNPHAVEAPTMAPGYTSIGRTLLRTKGITIGGIETANAQNEYEICFRCHGDSPVNIMGRIPRLADSQNVRLELLTSNPSFHPIVSSSVNPDVPSLIQGMPPGSLIRCTDCHNNDQTRRSGGFGPDGPHGSAYDFLLERNYTTVDNTAESAFAYALCYKCHERTSILNDESFDEHKKHIEGEDTPCSVCHDPHGIGQITNPGSNYTHLINFDLSVVTPSPTTGTIQFNDNGRLAGSCTLMCHGEDHVNEDYHQ